MLATLAQRLQRSQADTVRLVIREAIKSLELPTITPPTTPTAQPEPAAVRPC
jgi:hypothetical protein